MGDRPLVDWALDRVAPLVDRVAVNARAHAEHLRAHVEHRAHVSDERAYPEELGTGGAIGALREWLAGLPVLVVNGDTWTDVDLAPLLEGWDGTRVRVLVHGPPGTTLLPDAAWQRVRAANAGRPSGRPWRAQVAPGATSVVASLVPAADAARLPASPLGLSNGLWWPALADDRLDVITGEGVLISCDRPRDYLAANLRWSGGASVIGAGAAVEGEVVRSVVWPGAVVRTGERLVDAVRAERGVTVAVR